MAVVKYRCTGNTGYSLWRMEQVSGRLYWYCTRRHAHVDRIADPLCTRIRRVAQPAVQVRKLPLAPPSAPPSVPTTSRGPSYRRGAVVCLRAGPASRTAARDAAATEGAAGLPTRSPLTTPHHGLPRVGLTLRPAPGSGAAPLSLKGRPRSLGVDARYVLARERPWRFGVG